MNETGADKEAGKMEAISEGIFNSSDPDGLQARLTEFDSYYTVTLVDVESGKVIPSARRFPKSMKMEAVSYAMRCAG